MKILTTLPVSGGLNMASQAKDTFTIGTPLENNDGDVDDLYVYANANFKNNVILGSSSVDTIFVNGQFRTSASIYLDGQTSTLYVGNTDYIDYSYNKLNALKESEVTGSGIGIISDQDPSKYYLKSFVGDLDRINITSENNNSEIHIGLAPQQYDYSVLTPSTGTLGNGETSQSEAFYLKNNDTQNVTHSLPDAQTFVKRLLVVKNSSTQYNIVLKASGSQLIDGNSSLTLPINTSYTLQAIDDNGYKWKIIGSYNELNLFVSGTLTVGESIVPINSGTVSLGSSDKPFKEIFVGSGSISIASPISGVAATTISNNSGNLDISAGGVNLVGTGSFIGSGVGLYGILAKHINNAYTFLTASGQTASEGATVVYLNDGNNANYGLPNIAGHDGMIIFMKNMKNTQATIHPASGQQINGVVGTHTIAGNSYESFHAVSGGSGGSWYTLFTSVAIVLYQLWEMI